MSAAIQRKRINAKAKQIVNKEPSKYDQNHFQYCEHIKFFQSFETDFQKNLNAGNIKGIKETVEKFYQSIKTNQLLLNDLSDPGEGEEKNLTDILLLNKAKETVKMLADYIVNKKAFALKNNTSLYFSDILSSDTKEATSIILKVLKLFVTLNSEFNKVLSNLPCFIRRILRLTLENPKIYFESSLRILEALITENPNTINKDLYQIISTGLVNLPRKYFARFSRIIALFALENTEKTDFKELPLGFSNNKMIQIHSFLLSVPNFLETYVSILQSLKEVIQCLVAITPENLKKTVTYLKQSKILKNSGVSLSFLRPLFLQCQASHDLIKQFFAKEFIVKFIVRKSNITEILFLLSNLLAGKRKVDIQDQLTNLNFFERVLTPLFDILFDTGLGYENDSDGNADYMGNPLTTTRIQLLRVIINFCDRDISNTANKAQFISDEEKQHLDKHINSSSFNGEFLPGNMFANTINKGLLNKIISLLQITSGNSNFHFWLSSCVESFIRGFNYFDQVFIAHTGLLYHLMDLAVENQITKANNIQITYDLIGEIIKFNKHNIMFFESLCKQFRWTQTLLEHVETNVVDSNVFLRSILLTIEKLDLSSEKQENDDAISENSYSLFCRSLTLKRMDLMKSLVKAVDADKVNQDNICCINTTFIIAMFEAQRGRLQECLDHLFSDSKSDKKALTNFNKVLDVWHNYYLSKTKDCFSLQYTTSIKFPYFNNIQQKIKEFVEESISEHM